MYEEVPLPLTEAPPEPPLTPLSDTEMLPLPPVDFASKDFVSVDVKLIFSLAVVDTSNFLLSIC